MNALTFDMAELYPVELINRSKGIRWAASRYDEWFLIKTIGNVRILLN